MKIQALHDAAGWGVSALLTLGLLFGCGGSGGDNGGDANTTPADLVFSLARITSITPGEGFSFSLAGSDTAGGQYSGSIEIINRAQTTIDGQTVTPQETLFSLTNTVTGAFLTDSSTTYYNSNKEPVQVVYEDGMVEVPTNIAILPDTAKVGDFGDLSTFESSTGEVETGSWRLESASENTANLVLSTTERDSFGNMVNTEDDTFTITTDGTPVSISFRVFFADINVTLVLNGTPH